MEQDFLASTFLVPKSVLGKVRCAVPKGKISWTDIDHPEEILRMSQRRRYTRASLPTTGPP